MIVEQCEITVDQDDVHQRLQGMSDDMYETLMVSYMINTSPEYLHKSL